MPTIQISILPDLVPVDQYGEDDEGSNCPLPTRDADLNETNKEQAIDAADYRDPAEDAGSAVAGVCGNCKAYNQTDEMLDCIGDDSGKLGYCQLYKFVCAADHTCDDWVKGGPMTSENQQSYRDNL